MNKLKLFFFICCTLPSVCWGNTTFFQKVSERQQTLQTHLCLGLDPRPEWLKSEEAVTSWAKQLIDETKNYICCIKPNLAFYAQLGPEGLQALQEIIRYAKAHDIPVILDAKYGDIGSTAQAYARTAFDYFDADCVTLSPYLGYDTVKPFLAYEDKSVFVLAKTSNPSSQDLQDLKTKDGCCMYEQIAYKAQKWGPRVGIVVGATMPQEAEQIRDVNTASWILAPGIGAQGGDIENIVAAIGTNVIFPISRGIAKHKTMTPTKAAQFYKDAIERCFANQKKPKQKQSKSLSTDLLKHNIVKFGRFTLKSGAISPIYIDLRSIISHPDLLENIVDQYIDVIKKNNIQFDRVAGIAYGALGTAFAVAAKLNKPIVLVKKESISNPSSSFDKLRTSSGWRKGYGIETDGLIGEYKNGERILLIEDIATSGGSTVRVAQQLRKHNLVVSNAVVFLDRQAGAEKKLANKNITMHSVATLSELLDNLKQTETISDQTYNEVQTFMHGGPKEKTEMSAQITNISLETNLCGCMLRNPFIVASGAVKKTESFLKAVAGGCGAVTSKSVNCVERKGHAKPIHFHWEGGCINAEGLPGKGAEIMAQMIQDYKQQTDVPLIASVFGNDITECVRACINILEGNPDIIEINMSCPNVLEECGIPFACDATSAYDMIAAIKQVCDKPVFAKLAPNVPNIAAIAQASVAAGADGITLINTVPGMVIDSQTGTPILTNKTGGVSGPAIKQITLKAVYDVRRALPDIPIIGVGGVTNGIDAIEMFMAGATAVALCTATYTVGMDVFKKLTKEVTEFMTKHGFESLDELRGLAHS